MRRSHIGIIASVCAIGTVACIFVMSPNHQSYSNDEASIIFQRGLTDLRGGQYSSAETAFRQGLAIDPNNWLAHKYLADTLRKLGRPDYDVIREYEISAKNAGSTAAADLSRSTIAEMRDQADRQYDQKRSAARAADEERLTTIRRDISRAEQRLEAEIAATYRDAISFSEENITLQGRRFRGPTGASVPLTVSLKCPAVNKGIFEKIRRLPDGSFGRVRVRFVDKVADKMIVERTLINGPFATVFVIGRDNMVSDVEKRAFSIISKNVVDLMELVCATSTELAKSFQDAVRNNDPGKNFN